MSASAVNMQLTGDLTSGLDALEKRVKEEVMVSGVAAMARVIYDEVKLNVQPPRIGQKTGNLASGVYRYFATAKSSEYVKKYFVGVNHKKAPHWHLIEYGHWQPYQTVQLASGAWVTLKDRLLASPKWIPPRPFIRPAADHLPRAIEAGKARMKVVMAQGGHAGEVKT